MSVARPSTRVVVPLSALLLLLAAPGGWASGQGHAAGAKGTGGSGGTVAYGGVTPSLACHPDWTSCTATGSSDTTTGAISAEAAIRRDTAGTGLDEIDQLAWEGRSMAVPAHAKSVTATVVLTGIEPGAAAASSTDGGAVAAEWVGASITDTGCASFGCGASTATSYVNVRLLADVLGQRTKDSADGLASRTFTVTVSMPDGSDLPRGSIAAAGVVEGSAELEPLTCVDQTEAPQTCTTGTPHTGDAAGGITATVSQVSFTAA